MSRSIVDFYTNKRKFIDWTPASIPTYVWYDASDLSTITESGGLVSQLDDKSGNERHMVQTDGAEKPTTGVNTLGGLNVLDFGGSPINMETSVIYPGADDTIVIGVFLDEEATINNSLFTFPDQFGLESDRVYGGNSTGVFSANNITFTRITEWSIFGASLKWNVSASLPLSYGQAWNNGSQEGVNIAYTNELTSLSRRLVLMAGNNPTGATTGKFAEVIVTNNDSSIATRQKLEGYLAWKWNLQHKLPDNHPYKYNGREFGYGELWLPNQITTSAWYDASDSTTITESLGSVSQWDDKSGNNRHLTQGTASLQPTTSVNAIGGLNVISSDEDYMSASIASSTFPTSMQVTGVIKKTGANTTYEAFFGRTVGNKPSAVDRYNSFTYVGNGSSFAQVSGMTNIRNLTSATLISTLVNTTTVKEWIDGINATDTAHGTTYGDTATTFVLGSRADGVTTFRGDWGEIVLTEELSDLDRQKLEGYLAWKWGLQAKLPIGHPYENEPPTV